MTTEKKGHISRPAQYILAKNGNMGQSPNIMTPCRHATVMPSLTSIEQRLPNHPRKPPCHNRDNYRSNSGVLGFERTGMYRITSSSTNSCTVLSAPRGLVTYIQLCKPIIPRVRVNSSRLKSQNPYIHNKSRVDYTLKHINLNPSLAVYGAPLGQHQPCLQNVQQEVEKVQFHVYLPCDKHQPEEEVTSKFNSLSL